MKKYVTIILLIITTSCQESKNKIQENNSKQLELSDKTEKETSKSNTADSETLEKSSNKEYQLDLDSITPIFNYHSSPILNSNQTRIYWFNSQINSLDIYNLDKNILEDRIQFQLNGPNSIPGTGIGTGINFVNNDTIIFFSSQLKRIYLSNKLGEVYKKIDLSNYAHGFGSVSISSPIAYRRGNVFIQIMPNIPIDSPDFYSPDYNRIAKINLANGEFEEFYIDFPKISKGEGISQQLKMMNIIFNHKADKFIISSPLSEFIIVTDFKNYTESYEIKSSLVSEVIKFNQITPEVSASNLVNFFYWINSSYERMIYDPINDLYLREVRKGISEENFKKRDFSGEREIIVLNPEFEKIGSINLESSGIFYYFFTKNHFYWNKDLQKFNIETGVEDYILFEKELLDFD